MHLLELHYLNIIPFRGMGVWERRMDMKVDGLTIKYNEVASHLGTRMAGKVQTVDFRWC